MTVYCQAMIWNYSEQLPMEPQEKFIGNWFKTEKDHDLASPEQFFKRQIGIWNVKSTREILRFGVILSKATELIYEAYFFFEIVMPQIF